MPIHKEAVQRLESILAYCNEMQNKGSCFNNCALSFGWKCGIRALFSDGHYNVLEILEHAKERAEELESEEK